MKELGKKQITIKLLGDDTDDAKKTTEFIQSALESRLAKPVRPLSPLGPNYGRFFKNGVGYGPAFPDSLDTAHAIDESVSLAELEKSLAIYAEAIYELTK